jgi:dipeptidyl-peptidase 4
LSTPSRDESFNRHVYEYDLNTKIDQCLTCDEKTVELNPCSYATCSFSTDLSHYAMTCSGPDPSSTKIYRTDDRQLLRVWQENLPLRQRLNQYHLPRTEIFHVPVAGGFNAAVKMLIPPEINFDNPSASNEKYPMLVRVYGGPGSVRIANTFSVGYQVSFCVTREALINEILIHTVVSSYNKKDYLCGNRWQGNGSERSRYDVFCE